jgi:lipopolysaccharide/colanic/teichoic acid biosynthesis glycosyltransferase
VGKRVVDVVGASVLLLVAIPVIVVAALLSYLTYRDGPFFVQDRVGRDGRTFRLVKVRTLAPATPSGLPKAQLEAHRPGPAFRFLRAHHLDELPQLLNVLGGSMSLVGPRPEMVVLNELLPDDLARVRSTVRPGITGLWQISRAVELMIWEHPEYDRHYIAHRTSRLDLWILWRTATGLVGRAPITSLGEVPAWTGAPMVAAEASVDGAPV